MYISEQLAGERPARARRDTIVAVYRYQVVSVGWWRGKIKRWNTTFHLSTSSSTPTLLSKMQAAGWKSSGDVVGDCSGGVASITVYNAAGGAPIAKTVLFDWQTPTEWIPYTGTAWSAVDPLTPLDASGESAAVVVGKLPGLSASGKPMSTRKYLHAVPSRTATDYADPDIDAATQAALASLFTPSYMLSPSGITPSSVSCEPYYLNHQRVRGRRRTVTQVAAQSFSAGVMTGVGASGGGASPAQFQ